MNAEAVAQLRWKRRSLAFRAKGSRIEGRKRTVQPKFQTLKLMNDNEFLSIPKVILSEEAPPYPWKASMEPFLLNG